MTKESDPKSAETKKTALFGRLRTYFFTGLLVTAPPALTIYLAVLFVGFVDNHVRRLIPEEYNPEQYLPFAIPGAGVLAVILAMIGIGVFTTGFIGRFFMRKWEKMWEKIPFVSGVYSTFKQLFETIFSKKSNAFRQVVLVEFPRKDAWTLAFVTADVPADVQNPLQRDDLITVYVPTTPNPTSGYLMIYKKEDVIPVDMSVEDGLKYIISLGIVSKK